MSLRTLVAIPLFGAFLSGCFATVPVDRATPELGTEVALELNDIGRTALAPTMGDAIDVIHGHLITRDSSEYVVSVNSVDYLHGDSQDWAGALAHINNAYVRRYYSVKIDQTKTIAFAAVVVVGTALVITSLSTASSGGSEGTQESGPPGIQRVPPGLHIPLSPLQAIRTVARWLPHFAW